MITHLPRRRNHFRFLIQSWHRTGGKTEYTWYNCYSHTFTFHFWAPNVHVPFMLWQYSMGPNSFHCGLTTSICLPCLVGISQSRRKEPASVHRIQGKVPYLPRSFSTLVEFREDSDEFFSFRYNPNHRHRYLPNLKYWLQSSPMHPQSYFAYAVNAVIKQNFVQFVAIHVFTYWLCLLPTDIGTALRRL